MIICGIDPGYSGAICINVGSSRSGNTYHFFDMPLMTNRAGKNLIDASQVANILRNAHVERVHLEQVGAMPGQGVSSMFRFGQALGIIEGIVSALDIELMHITPQAWKKPLGLIGTDKDYARTLAIQRHPQIAQHLARKKDSGRADAFWLCNHAR